MAVFRVERNTGYTVRKGKDWCTTHSIKNVVLHEIVLRNLREAIEYVTQYEAEFIQEAADSRLRERDAEFSRKRETLSRAESRIAELDNLFKHLYEDNVTGKLSDERHLPRLREYRAALRGFLHAAYLRYLYRALSPFRCL